MPPEEFHVSNSLLAILGPFSNASTEMARAGLIVYSCFSKGCPTKAYATTPIGIMVRNSLVLIEVHDVYQQEKIRHTFICLCCFPLCR